MIENVLYDRIGGPYAETPRSTEDRPGDSGGGRRRRFGREHAPEATFGWLDDSFPGLGSWHSRYASLLNLPELDVGYRLVTAELG